MQSYEISPHQEVMEGIAPKVKRSQRIFNRGFLDRQDPIEALGEHMLSFSLNSIYTIEDRKKIPEIAEAIYNSLIQKLEMNSLGSDVEYQLIDYQDAQQKGKEGPRKYLVISRETNRNTHITVLARFLTRGDNLYVAVDSYVLGQLNVRAVVWRVFLTLLPFIFLCLIFLGLLVGIQVGG